MIVGFYAGHLLRAILKSNPMFERPNNLDREHARENEVVRFLARVRQYGQEPRNCEILQEFIREQEARANADDSDRGNIKCAITLARVYGRAGYLLHAIEELESTRLELAQGDHDDLLEYTEALLDTFARELH